MTAVSNSLRKQAGSVLVETAIQIDEQEMV
jgi:hypothetical protein